MKKTFSNFRGGQVANESFDCIWFSICFSVVNSYSNWHNFHQFLDRCTDAVGLPFAARRLYTKDGKEVRRLSDLQRDELVYVTCGEPWSDPQLSYSEQQRRTVLANLASDICHIRQYCALRDPAGRAASPERPLSLPWRTVHTLTVVLISLLCPLRFESAAFLPFQPQY